MTASQEAINSVNSTLKRSVVLSHPGCGSFVQEAARGLHEAGLLAAYVTTFSYWPGTWSGRVLKAGLRVAYSEPEKQLRRRQIIDVPPALVINHPLPEFFRSATAKSGLGDIASNLVWERTEKWFDRIVARKHLGGTAAVYGYEHACLETFRAQRALGGLCIYDQPIAHHDTVSKILDEEFKKFPEMKTSRDVHIEHRRHKYNARKDAELALADRVVVASNFVRESLISAGYPSERIWVIPSGAPTVETSRRKLDSKKFIILVAGHLSARKGTHYLLQAWRRLSPPGNVELWMVGKWLLPAIWREGLPSNVCISDTVPREKLFNLFDQANVLVFPTLAEGLALTPLEAMARAVPVITTPSSGADQFIRDGENGRLIRPCDVDALANVLSWAIEHPAELYEMGMRAAATMAAWQWSDYRSQLGEKVATLLAGS